MGNEVMSGPIHVAHPMPMRPDDDAPLAEKALWLLQTHAYCAADDTIVQLYQPNDACQIKPAAFQRLFRSWREEIIGPKKGKAYDYATARWEVDEARLNVEGVRMRPDKPFPVYQEDDGAYFKNTYRPPVHTGNGNIRPWLRMMVHLLPVRSERKWFCDWLAHKYCYPGVPGVAVIMVAANSEGPVYGTGRGMLRDILARLLGAKYVKPLDFDVFTGKSAQGVYTDWGAYAILVTVNEAKDTADSGRWSERRAVYERIKEIVDPRPIERTFTVKGRQAFQALSFASYLIFSNNRDAVQIPDGDRRAAGLANGKQMSAEMAVALQEWMDQPGNISALGQWLAARDLSHFNAYMPPVTETKTIMQELARNAQDDAFAFVRRLLGRSALFTGELILQAIVNELGGGSASDELQRWVKRRVRSETTMVGDRFRMPRAFGVGARHAILRWRDYNGPADISIADAQSAVAASERLIAKAQEDPPAAPPADGATITVLHTNNA
jgi:hypothetical protein